MPGVTQEVRTIMYSVVDGNVVVHKFPFNANEKYGMTKLEKFLKRGFTFNDPRKRDGQGLPEVIVTAVVDLAKPILAEQTNETEMPNLLEMAMAELSDNETTSETTGLSEPLTVAILSEVLTKNPDILPEMVFKTPKAIAEVKPPSAQENDPVVADIPTPAEILKQKRQAQMAKARAAKKANGSRSSL